MITCGSLLARLAFKADKIKQDFTYQPTITILMSCFNEGESVYTTIKSVVEAEYPKENLFVIAIDDCSKDKSWEWMQKAAADFPNVRVYRNESNLGKPKSLLKALAMADTELILNIDSDCGLHPRSIIELTSCFADPTVGAVGGSVLVRNMSKNLLTQMQAIQYNTSFQIAKMGENLSKAVNCISGCLFAVRRSIYDELAPAIKSRTWFGHEVKDGEDRYMTNLILSLGYKTMVNLKSIVYTDVPEKFPQFFSQQLRWRRGFVRMFLWSMRPAVIIDKADKLSFVAFIKHYAICSLLILMPIFAIWIQTTEGIVAFIDLKFHFMLLIVTVHGISYMMAKAAGNELTVSPIAFIITPFWMIIDLFFLTVLAFATLTSVSWETRQ